MTTKQVLVWLKARGTARNREGMARYGISSPKLFGVSMATMRPLVKTIGRDHDLALKLWQTGWLEARILASFIVDPDRMTAAQMEQWARDFDNWAVCDSVCLHLFSYARPRWSKAAVWPRRKAEFVRRAGCALIASLAVHDRAASHEQFEACLPLLEGIAGDDRPLVTKGVSWALRQIGKRDSVLHAMAVAAAERLRSHESRAARWIARDVLKELRSDAVRTRLARRSVSG